MNTIRLLKAEEIECRVAQCGKNARGAWCTILLYKDARVDQKILDEVFGVFNWKRSHELIGGRLYCTVSIWDADKKEWISKQDVGTESYTEKEKGQASDAFKRACFNVGIGRELYTAPKIYINLNADEYTGDSEKVSPKIKLDVAEIKYDGSRQISFLQLVDEKGRIRYTYDRTKSSAARSPVNSTPSPRKAPEEDSKYLQFVDASARNVMTKKGLTARESFIKHYNATTEEATRFDEDVLQYKINNNI